MISRQMEEYIEAIGRLEERGKPVTTSVLATEIGVAAPSATEMLRRLADEGLVDYEPRHEPTLTKTGRDAANKILRRHRLWERFLHDVLQLSWDKVHELACEFEHATSPELERGLAESLGESVTCPHGHAIPGVAEEPAPGQLVRLSALLPAQAARVVCIDEEGEDLLKGLGDHGIRPGARVLVDGGAAGDALAMHVDGRRELVSRASAEQVRVRLATPEQERQDGANLPLGALEPGEVGVVRAFRDGRGLMGRCLALGFTPGTEVKMLQNLHGGPVIVLVRDTRIAFGRSEANKILVSRKANNDDGTN